MRRIVIKLISLCALMLDGQGAVAANEMRKWLWSDTTAYGLARDLSHGFEAPDALISLTVRPFEAADEAILFDTIASDSSDPDGSYSYLLKNRRAFLRAGIPTCFVAATAENTPCYVQWLIGPESNPRLKEYFGGIFPELAPHERLLEYAYTPQAFQGKRIMAAAMARVAEQALATGATRAITFVDTDNIPAIKGCRRAGFEPYVRRVTAWRLFRRSVRFEPLAATADVDDQAIGTAAGSAG